MENITKQKLNDAELKTAREAKAANRAKSEFLAHMSHELRAPLNGILGFSQILKRDKTLNSKQQDAVHTINKSGEHLLTLINDILDISKIEAGKMELYLREFKFKEFIMEINDITDISSRQSGIDFIYRTLSPLPVTVNGDKTRLRQVLVNLLGNAIKFTKQGAVSFEVGYPSNQDKNTIRFQIKDTGSGIAPEQLETIFKPFQQVGEQLYMSEGSGLGLPISQKLVKRRIIGKTAGIFKARMAILSA